MGKSEHFFGFSTSCIPICYPISTDRICKCSLENQHYYELNLFSVEWPKKKCSSTYLFHNCVIFFTSANHVSIFIRSQRTNKFTNFPPSPIGRMLKKYFSTMLRCLCIISALPHHNIGGPTLTSNVQIAIFVDNLRCFIFKIL